MNETVTSGNCTINFPLGSDSTSTHYNPWGWKYYTHPAKCPRCGYCSHCGRSDKDDKPKQARKIRAK